MNDTHNTEDSAPDQRPLRSDEASAREPIVPDDESEALAAEKEAARAESHSEDLRKLLHLATVLPVLALPWLPRWLVIAATGALMVFNMFILPRWRLGRRVIRPGEGLFSPVRTYPMALFSAALVFPLHVLAASWTVLAIGDAVSNLAGRHLGRRHLPWHKKKTWVGTIAGLLVSFGAAIFAVWWCQYWNPEASFGVNVQDGGFAMVLLAFVAATAGMLVETIDAPFDDNFLVMQSAALGGLLIDLYVQGTAKLGFGVGALLWAALLSTVLAGLAYLMKAVNATGAIVGALLAFLVYATLNWPGFVLLTVFVAVATGATALRPRRKRERGDGEHIEESRSVRHAVANLSAPAALALLYFVGVTRGWPLNHLLLLGFVGAIAAALADTLGSEVGMLASKEPVLITHWRRRVPHGTDGGITRLGMIASLGAGLLVGLLALIFDLGAIHKGTDAVAGFGFGDMLIVAAAGLLGSLVDSLLGATIQGRWRWANNETVNFLCTVSGAGFAVLIQLGLSGH